jgi:mannose-1-phosphate guanylyltransferase / mannose-6-phosphate isomerase
MALAAGYACGTKPELEQQLDSTMKVPIIPVFLCGGSGTRLWPLSRAHLPKQFLCLASTRSLVQDTFTRVKGMAGLGRAIAVTNEDHRFLLAEQLREIREEADILLEPAARNTAPAVAAAAHWALSRAACDGVTAAAEAPLLLVLPSDHVIADAPAFRKAVAAGIPHAHAGSLVTFGIVPRRPETGYGYIRRGVAVDGGFRLERFVEKPDADTAAAYLAGGDYYWNSGMFLFRADVYLDLLGRHAPAMVEATREAVERVTQDLDFLRLDAAAFARCPADSIDYAVMEKAAAGVVVPLDAGWSDIGAWDALYEIGEEDVDGNRSHGDVLLHDTRGSLVRAESRLVAAVGLSEVLIVETADAVLVAGKGHGQAVKHVVARLREGSRSETEFHTLVHRPWGSYEGVAKGERYQVKRIAVKPGCSLSLQKHHHRAEHWVVVKGTARVTRGEEVLILSENESTYIPLGVVHRLENPGKIDLEIVEIQSGSYLGEDDIVRLEDSYGRETTQGSRDKGQDTMQGSRDKGQDTRDKP